MHVFLYIIKYHESFPLFAPLQPGVKCRLLLLLTTISRYAMSEYMMS